MNRVVSIDFKTNTLSVGNVKVDVNPSRAAKEIQKDFYEAFTALDDTDRYIASLEIVVDVFVGKAFPKSLTFAVDQFIHPSATS